VIGHVIEVNPAHGARSQYVVRKGKTAVLTAEKARDVLDSIPIMRNTGPAGKVNQKCNADSWWLLSSEYSEYDTF
jgi:altronate dehydratase